MSFKSFSVAQPAPDKNQPAGKSRMAPPIVKPPVTPEKKTAEPAKS
jgi:hypothetical protein